MKSDTLLIAECAEYLPPELLKEVARRLEGDRRHSARLTPEDVNKALNRVLYQFHKWTYGKPNFYDDSRRDFLSMFREGDQ